MDIACFQQGRGQMVMGLDKVWPDVHCLAIPGEALADAIILPQGVAQVEAGLGPGRTQANCLAITRHRFRRLAFEEQDIAEVVPRFRGVRPQSHGALKAITRLADAAEAQEGHAAAEVGLHIIGADGQRTAVAGLRVGGVPLLLVGQP
jgi:hypothetical protein